MSEGLKKFTEDELKKAKKTQYMRQWRKENPTKVEKNRVHYWIKKAQEKYNHIDVSDEEVRAVKADYARHYRATHKKTVAKQKANYYANLLKKLSRDTEDEGNE